MTFRSASTNRRNHLRGRGELDLIEVLDFLGRQITFQPVSPKIIYTFLDLSQKNILKSSPFWSGRASLITSSSNFPIFSCSRECGCWPSATMVNHWEEYQFSTALLPPVHIWALLNTLLKSYSGEVGRGGGIAQWERGRDSPMRSIKRPLQKDLDCFPSAQMIMGRKVNSFCFRSSKKISVCVQVPRWSLRVNGMPRWDAGVTQTLSFIGYKRIDIFSTTPGTSCPAEPTIDLCV